MLLNFLDAANVAKDKEISGAESIFGLKFNEPLVHQVIVSYMANARAGTKAQKTRAAVSGGGKKPWRQKGSGRARAGTSRSPIWRKGGVIFAASPRDHSQKINKKMYRLALCSILAELNRKQHLFVVESLEIASAKTSLLVSKLQEYKLNDVLIITEQHDDNLFLAARNLPTVHTSEVEHINPLMLVSYKNVIFTIPAIKALEKKYGDRAA